MRSGSEKNLAILDHNWSIALALLSLRARVYMCPRASLLSSPGTRSSEWQNTYTHTHLLSDDSVSRQLNCQSDKGAGYTGTVKTGLSHARARSRQEECAKAAGNFEFHSRSIFREKWNKALFLPLAPFIRIYDENNNTLKAARARP